jgi:hypothetical protein
MSTVRKPGKSQDGRIHLEQPHQAIYWAKKFEVSCVQLYKAISSTGSNKVDTVARQLLPDLELLREK